MAGLDGIQNRIEPPPPVDKDLYDLPPEELAKVPQVPCSLDEALNALEDDNDFLKAGGVFTDDLIETWIDYKRENEIDAHPAAPAPVRVRALLRHLNGENVGGCKRRPPHVAPTRKPRGDRQTGQRTVRSG